MPFNKFNDLNGLNDQPLTPDSMLYALCPSPYTLRPTLFAFPPCPMLLVGTGLIGLASLGKKKFGN
jgi:hypothetical protein